MKRPNVCLIAVIFLVTVLLEGSSPFVLPNSLCHTRCTTKNTCGRWFECEKKKHSSKSDKRLRLGGKPQRTCLTSKEFDGGEHVEPFPDLTPVCRIVTRSGKRIPTDPSILPPGIYQSPYLLDKLDAYYHAKARNVQQDLSPLRPDERKIIEGSNTCVQTRTQVENENIDENTSEINREVPVLRHSLEDAGFKLLSQRDMDLCESLNAGYLLRLSLLPDVRELDPVILKEFYPERFHANGTFKTENEGIDNILFDGRVLVYWRGYSQEVTKGRLLLPKLDYLQANLVQRAAVWVKKKLDRFESSLFRNIRSKGHQIQQTIRNWRIRLSEKLQIPQFKQWIDSIISDENQLQDQLSMPKPIDLNEETFDNFSSMNKKIINVNKRKTVLSRYEGFKTVSMGSPDPLDALSPFTLCEIDYNEENNPVMEAQRSSTDISVSDDVSYEDSNRSNPITCAYDGIMSSRTNKELPRMQLLERVSIGSLIDVFDKVRRRGLVKTLFAKSELVEPTYEEVVVVWRPLVKQKKKIVPPKVVSEFADMFDIEGFEQPEEDFSEPETGNLEIRLFEQVPMSNLQAVMPKSKLVFRPADAFLFDTISFSTFAIVLGSTRFDNTRLDLLALVSVTLWILRTVFRYSNKLARYDLLVKTFLTSKISQRNAGALQYLSYEAGSQRAIRAALVHRWALEEFESERSTLTKSSIEMKCETRVNQLLNTENEVQIDVKRAIKDLEDMNLLLFSKTDNRVLMVEDLLSSTNAVEELWLELLESNRRFSAGSMNELDFKSDPVVTEDEMDILDVLEEIDNAAASVQKLSASDWRERRKVFATKIEEKKDMSIAKAKAAIEEKKEESIAKAKAALEVKKEASIAKAKALLAEKKDESIAKAKAVLEEKKEKSIAKAKAALEEGKDAGISKAREFLRENRNQQSKE